VRRSLALLLQEFARETRKPASPKRQTKTRNLYHV
jgi:hypothetical protein